MFPSGGGGGVGSSTSHRPIDASTTTGDDDPLELSGLLSSWPSLLSRSVSTMLDGIPEDASVESKGHWALMILDTLQGALLLLLLLPLLLLPILLLLPLLLLPLLLLLTYSITIPDFNTKQSNVLNQLRKSYSSSISSSSSTSTITQLTSYTKYVNSQASFCRLLTQVIDRWVAASSELESSSLSSDLLDRLMLTCSTFHVSSTFHVKMMMMMIIIMIVLLLLLMMMMMMVMMVTNDNLHVVYH